VSLRVLVADDAILFRRVISGALASLPDVEVVGSVPNGRIALQKIKELKPDLLTLDLEMPDMDGLAVLNALREARDPVSVIVVSALTRHGGQLTLKALEMGAFDFLTKPETSGAEESIAAVRRELAPRVRALAHRRAVHHILHAPQGPGQGQTHAHAHAYATPALAPVAVPAAPCAPRPAASAFVPRNLSSPAAPSGPARSASPDLSNIAGRMNRIAAVTARPDLVLIGVSTGGPKALATVLPQLPADLDVPILVVQHMPPVFTQSLAESLAAKCALPVREASQNEIVEPRRVYIAPGGRQMRIAPGGSGSRILQITDDPPENNCRPAVDYLFRSAAAQFPGRSMAVILTGMGNDGTVGLRLLKRAGCFSIAQDEATCVVYGMPRAAVEAGVVDVVLPLEAIASRITAVVRGSCT
jgi:two-component system chemotaxis response regulator CheB